MEWIDMGEALISCGILVCVITATPSTTYPTCFFKGAILQMSIV